MNDEAPSELTADDVAKIQKAIQDVWDVEQPTTGEFVYRLRDSWPYYQFRQLLQRIAGLELSIENHMDTSRGLYTHLQAEEAERISFKERIAQLEKERKQADMNLRSLCMSLMLFFGHVDDSQGDIEVSCGDEGYQVVSQLRGILGEVNPCPNFMTDPTDEEIAAMQAEPGYAEREQKLLEQGRAAFQRAWQRATPIR